MQKTGQVERTVDREFTDEEAKYRTCVAFLQTMLLGSRATSLRYEKEVEKLQKEAKAYLDSMRGKCVTTADNASANEGTIAMASSQSRIADTIDKFYGSADRTSDGAMAANAYKRSVDELDSSISRELVSAE